MHSSWVIGRPRNPSVEGATTSMESTARGRRTTGAAASSASRSPASSTTSSPASFRLAVESSEE